MAEFEGWLTRADSVQMVWWLAQTGCMPKRPLGYALPSWEMSCCRSEQLCQ